MLSHCKLISFSQITKVDHKILHRITEFCCPCFKMMLCCSLYCYVIHMLQKAQSSFKNSGLSFKNTSLTVVFHPKIIFVFFRICLMKFHVFAVCTEKHFVFRYTFTITVMATLINMTPYCIVVVYCWYQTRIPGVWVSCFRYFHTLLHCICALMLILQAFTENNLQNDASSVQSQGDSVSEKISECRLLIFTFQPFGNVENV